MPVLGDVRPLEAERLPAAGVKLAMQHGQPIPPVQGLGLYPQPLKVAHDVRLYTPQTGTRRRHIFSGDAKGDVLVTVRYRCCFWRSGFSASPCIPCGRC